MKKGINRTRRHARHERHENGGSGMSGMAEKGISPQVVFHHATHAAMPLNLKSFFLGGDIQPPRTRKEYGMSRLLEAAQRYTAAGLATIPLWPDKRKNPRLSTFEEFHYRIPTPQEWERWARKWPDSNIGLITGYHHNFVALDFDEVLTYDVWLKKWGQEFSNRYDGVPPISWLVRTKRGYHVWFQTRTDPGKSRIFVKDGLEVLLRAKGGYCIVPPSIHHTGTPYKTVCNVLPMVVDSVLDILPGWQEKVTPQGETIQERSLLVTPTKVRLESLIPPEKEHPNSRGAYLAKCPFHPDRKPSAWINIQEQRFGCNKCWPGLWWDVFNVYAMLRQISNGDAYTLLKGAI